MDKRFDIAQTKELSFWRNWCLHVRRNYATPLDYVRHRIKDTLETRGMTVEDFRGKSVIEYGPGMYPMVAALPVGFAMVVEPLLREFDEIINATEVEIWRNVSVSWLRGEDFTPGRYDYCLLKNVLDHTTRPADLVANINADIVLVDSFVGRDEDTTLHPSAFKTVDEVKVLFTDYRCTFEACDEQLKNHYLTFERVTNDPT